ncbi:hypothetical protein WK73_04440 [Burkholderia ubonensis]|uniref:hypothetical protein n=1 Tax=Burkholderia ubonensis TaxID=101571 RepID=UPI00075C0ED4|nr:hypothetical protein [Burkholderia ubonensis]KVU80049.1 hypothetical protein WK73_04440 [Burkholderia ubonensis]KWC67472.1 hypothetical protein WL53_06050 [Burkholderia ubonensis]
MNEIRKQAIWKQVLSDLVGMNVGPNQSVPVKTVWLRAVKNGITNAAELEEVLSWAVEAQLLTSTDGGIAGLGTIALTDTGYEQSQSEF